MADTSPLVSVIMPAYNAEPYIEEAIRSVLGQSVSDLELIIIDDCSTDATPDIICRLAGEDSRILPLVNEHNMGVARTRNRGLDLSRGSFVAFIDSDDVWEPQKLEQQIQLAESSGADIVYCSYSIIDTTGKPCCKDFIVPPDTNFKESLYTSVISCSTALFRRATTHKYRFPTDLYHEDLALWLDMLGNGLKACGVTEPLAAYRLTASGRASNKLNTVKHRWLIYRKHLKLPLIKSCGVLLRYAFLAMKKYAMIKNECDYQ